MAQTPQRTDLNLDEFRHLLRKERTHLEQLLAEQHRLMREEMDDVSTNELSSTDYNEPGDISAPLADNDREKPLVAEAQEQLKQVHMALDRIEDGSYGVCVVTGQPIPIARLRALPWASMTVEAAEEAVQ